MNQFGLITEIDHLRRHQELLREAARYHLANEAARTKKSTISPRTKVLAWVGKHLSSLGDALLELSDDQLAANSSAYEKSDTRGWV